MKPETKFDLKDINPFKPKRKSRQSPPVFYAHKGTMGHDIIKLESRVAAVRVHRTEQWEPGLVSEKYPHLMYLTGSCQDD